MFYPSGTSSSKSETSVVLSVSRRACLSRWASFLFTNLETWPSSSLRVGSWLLSVIHATSMVLSLLTKSSSWGFLPSVCSFIACIQLDVSNNSIKASLPVLSLATAGLSGDKDGLWALLVFLGDPGFGPPALLPHPHPNIVAVQ